MKQKNPISLARIGFIRYNDEISHWHSWCMCAHTHAFIFIVHHTEKTLFLGSIAFYFSIHFCWNSCQLFVVSFFYRRRLFPCCRLSNAINGYNIKINLLMKWANRANQRKCLDKYLFIRYNFCCCCCYHC